MDFGLACLIPSTFHLNSIQHFSTWISVSKPLRFRSNRLRLSEHEKRVVFYFFILKSQWLWRHLPYLINCSWKAYREKQKYIPLHPSIIYWTVLLYCTRQRKCLKRDPKEVVPGLLHYDMENVEDLPNASVVSGLCFLKCCNPFVPVESGNRNREGEVDTSFLHSPSLFFKQGRNSVATLQTSYRAFLIPPALLQDEICR